MTIEIGACILHLAHFVLPLTTAPSVPPGDLVVTATGSRSIALTWQALQEEDRNGFIQRYIIRVTANDSDEVVEMYSTMLEATVSNLHPFTTYLCVVAAETIEIGPFTDSEAVTTPEDGESALNTLLLCITAFHISFSPFIYSTIHSSGECYGGSTEFYFIAANLGASAATEQEWDYKKICCQCH